MALQTPGLVPHQTRRSIPLDDVEREVARTAELVLRLTALADRYAGRPESAERVALMRSTASLGREALVQIAAEPLAV
ncbi:MAG: hypothetical protein JWM62_1053 [Frankiales bacterium]|jgi:hypothetical protein|nr:hypothetical protein [Frankiales bacterium]